MSTKKKFSIPQGLATGIRTSIQSATTNHGQLHYDMMAIEMIETDPENPRKLAITKAELLTGLNKSDIHYEKKAKELDALNDLAESIKKVGIRNAIEVYKVDNKYRIISGERRYLAATLAGQKYVPTRINQKLDEFKLRYIQWVENINRQDLSVWERYNNLLSMAAAYQKNHATEMNAAIMQELLGVSETQAYRYSCLLIADKEIISLVKSEKLTNLKLIQELVCIKNKNARLKALADIQHAKENISSLSQLRKRKTAKLSSKNTISLGSVVNSKSAKYVFDAILNDDKLKKYQTQFTAINWDSGKAISKAFKELLNIVNKEVNTEETAHES